MSTIVAIDLGKFKSVACIYPVDPVITFFAGSTNRPRNKVYGGK